MSMNCITLFTEMFFTAHDVIKAYWKDLLVSNLISLKVLDREWLVDRCVLLARMLQSLQWLVAILLCLENLHTKYYICSSQGSKGALTRWTQNHLSSFHISYIS